MKYKVGHLYKRVYDNNYSDRYTNLYSIIVFRVISLGMNHITVEVVYSTDQWVKTDTLLQDISYKFPYAKTTETNESKLIAMVL